MPSIRRNKTKRNGNSIPMTLEEINERTVETQRLRITEGSNNQYQVYIRKYKLYSIEQNIDIESKEGKEELESHIVRFCTTYVDSDNPLSVTMSNYSTPALTCLEALW
jgi:hypothetical protein